MMNAKTATMTQSNTCRDRGNADCACQPQPCTGGEANDIAARLYDVSGSEESDARSHRFNRADRIRVPVLA